MVHFQDLLHVASQGVSLDHVNIVYPQGVQFQLSVLNVLKWLKLFDVTQ